MRHQPTSRSTQDHNHGRCCIDRRTHADRLRARVLRLVILAVNDADGLERERSHHHLHSLMCCNVLAEIGAGLAHVGVRDADHDRRFGLQLRLGPGDPSDSLVEDRP